MSKTTGTRLLGNSTLRKRIRLGSLSFTYLALIIFAVLIVFYVYQASVVANRGYSLSSLEREVGEKQAEGQRLEVEAARLKALHRIEESVLSDGDTADLNQQILERAQGGFQQLMDEEADSLSAEEELPKMVLVSEPTFVSVANAFADLPSTNSEGFIN